MKKNGEAVVEVNGATLGVDRHGQTNRAYSFDGVDDYVRTHVLADSQELTFSSWVYVLEQIDDGWGNQMMLFDLFIRLIKM